MNFTEIVKDLLTTNNFEISYCEFDQLLCYHKSKDKVFWIYFLDDRLIIARRDYDVARHKTLTLSPTDNESWVHLSYHSFDPDHLMKHLSQ